MLTSNGWFVSCAVVVVRSILQNLMTWVGAAPPTFGYLTAEKGSLGGTVWVRDP